MRHDGKLGGFDMNMVRRRTLAVGAVLAAAVLFAGGLAQATAVFDGFVSSMREVCSQQPSTSCAFAVRTYLDADGNGSVTQDEVIQARDEARAAMASNESQLSPEARSIIAVALLVTQDEQIPGVFSNFDSNGDGGIDEDEMFADFTLDQRPFTEVVSDPDAVDWQSFATRFGPTGLLIIALLPEEYR
jgi:hypothetical protein